MSGIAFGAGSGAFDTNLYRSTPDVLKTDDVLSVDALHRAQARCVGRTFLAPFVMAVTHDQGAITRYPHYRGWDDPWRGYSR
jgi:hypothetical protein